MVHDYAELPEGSENRQKFYATVNEMEWAQEFRDRIKGPMVLLSPTGSGPFKAWPHAQRFMEIMADEGVYTVMVGDLKHLPDLDLVERHGEEYGVVAGMEFPLRLSLALSLLADAVVATESVFANAVAMEDMPKVVMLSHSSHENLTRDWSNTAALQAPVPCYPCHRIHNSGMAMCSKDLNTRASACMASYSAEYVSDLERKALGIAEKAAA